MFTSPKVIVTGFSREGYEKYGRRMVESYHESFPLIIYTWDLDLLNLKNIEQRNQKTIPGLMEFTERYRDDQAAWGRVPKENWKPSELRAGYSFRYDAGKFSRMVFTMWDAAARLGEGLMIWLDGDSVIRKSLPKDFFERFLPEDAAYAYLGREKFPGFTDTGFVIFRVPDALPILEKWKDFYVTGEVFCYPEWHSAYMFDRAREFFPGIKGHNLTPNGWDHAIHQCEVGEYIDHLKGSRKEAGRSPETTFRWKVKSHMRKMKLFPFLRTMKKWFYR